MKKRPLSNNSLDKDIVRACMKIQGSTRLLAESIKVFAVTRKDIKKYKEFLWDDNEIADVPCSYKATTHCSMAIAGIMTSVYNNFLTNVKSGFAIRNVPFLTELELPTLTFNTETNGDT